jgi:transposase
LRKRFERGGVASLADRPRPGRGTTLSPEQARRVFQAVGEGPPRGVPRWTLSLLARAVGLSRSAVYRLLRSRGVDLGGRRG